MSLVGTRPILQDELLKYELHHRARIAIKPGITGMWQVSGRSDITDFEEVVRLDMCCAFFYDITQIFYIVLAGQEKQIIEADESVTQSIRKIQLFIRRHEDYWKDHVKQKIELETFYFYGNSCLVSDIQITNLFAAELLMPYEVFRKNFFAHMNELEITPGKVRLDEAIRLIVCQMSDFLVPYVISIN